MDGAEYILLIYIGKKKQQTIQTNLLKNPDTDPAEHMAVYKRGMISLLID